MQTSTRSTRCLPRFASSGITVLGLVDRWWTRSLGLDTRIGSRHKNMKELRPGSAGRSEVRILFAFDPKRRAIMLLAGDKHGAWQKWYRKEHPDR